MSITQEKLFTTTVREIRHERSCYVCHGIQTLCTDAVCPVKIRARSIAALTRAIKSTNLFGASPPGIFVGQRGYPRLTLAPLIPPTANENTSIMDAPENWLNLDVGKLLEYRLTLLRARSTVPVSAPRIPTRILSTAQELVMSSEPVDTEVWFTKKPALHILISPREAPVGPFGNVAKLTLAENPRVPRPVENVVSDRDMPAELGVFRLYDGGITQRQITRMFSVGLLGTTSKRRLVPTEWSITAIDDILAKQLRREVLTYPKIGEYLVFGHRALANSVQVLLTPTAWMYEALEAWVASPHPAPFSDYELSMGRKTYPQNLVGAYHAARLPVLEYLQRIRRQAGAIVFMEVGAQWIPLGVWRFREICREALRRPALKFSSIHEALAEIGKRLELPIASWIRVSRIVKFQKEQARMERFLNAH